MYKGFNQPFMEHEWQELKAMGYCDARLCIDWKVYTGDRNCQPMLVCAVTY